MTATPMPADRRIGAEIDRRMAVVFGLLVLAVMVTMVIVVALLSRAVLVREENRLATVVSAVIGEAVNRISFSGRYHSQLLIDELRSGQPAIVYIAIRDADGTMVAQSEWPFRADEDLPIARDDERLLLAGERNVVIADHELDGSPVKTVALPHRSGYAGTITGTIHVGIGLNDIHDDMLSSLQIVGSLGALLLVTAVVAIHLFSTRLGAPVRTQAEQLHGILDFAPFPIVIRDRDGTIIEASASFNALMPTGGDVLGLPQGPEDEVSETQPVARGEAEVVINGAARLFAVTKFAISKDSAGRPTRICTVAADVTERRRAEGDLRQRTLELERSNAELEQFAYVASHDLQEPLRMIGSYVALLARRYSDRLDADGLEFIAFAKEGAERMQQLILDLLEFSRVGRVRTPPEELSMAAPLNMAMTALRPAIEECGATVAIPDELPAVRGSLSELTRFWQNLIGNAIKYRHPDRPPRIDITVRRDDGSWVFTIADNGIGIPPEYHDRVFLIFQRLHTRDRYPGSGIGLALCKKIVTQHGGSVEVESRDVGTAFHVRFPAMDGAVALPANTPSIPA